MSVVIGTIISMYVMHWVLSGTTWIGIDCTVASGGGDLCVGPSLLVRMSFALALCHTICFGVCCLRNEMAAKFNEGCWCFKILIVVAMMVGGLWIPNEPFYFGYLHFAQWTSFFFLAFQAVLMLIVAYVVNDVLISNVNREGAESMTCSGIILIVSTLLLTTGNITWIVLQFIWFTGKDCSFNTCQMTFTCIAGVAMYVIVLFRTRNDASIFTSSIVLCYNLYLQWSALSSNPFQ